MFNISISILNSVTLFLVGFRELAKNNYAAFLKSNPDHGIAHLYQTQIL